MITIDMLKAAGPEASSAVLSTFLTPLDEVMTYYEINTTERISGFLSQVAHESGGFKFIKENLNYSADGLLKVFPKYFPTPDLAAQYARKPEKIANRVYANRMGNGPETSGDGYKFCGRGLIQLTGKNNYTRFAEGLGMTIDECVSYMETPEGACSSAGWFWDQNELNSYCDSGDFIGLTKRINGGTNGMDDRHKRYENIYRCVQI